MQQTKGNFITKSIVVTKKLLTDSFMDYDFIKILCTRRGLSMNKLSHAIGFSEPGFYRMIKANTMKVEILERISEVLKVNPAVFFKDELKATIVNEPETPYITTAKPTENNANTFELIELQRFKIKALEAEIAELKNKQ
jgi:transcriptional regulator with XRE-family HTH domain